MKNMRMDGIKQADLEAIEHYTSLLIDFAKKACRYSHGMGFCRIKVHLLVKMLSVEIKKYGTPDNVSGMPGESQFKEHFKLPGSTARFTQEFFDQDCYQRKHQHMVIKKCQQVIQRS